MNPITKKAIDRAIDQWVAPPLDQDAPFAFLMTDEPTVSTPGGYAPRRLEPSYRKSVPMGGREKFAWFLALVATLDLAVLGVAWLVAG